jgi:hypothetical protein
MLSQARACRKFFLDSVKTPLDGFGQNHVVPEFIHRDFLHERRGIAPASGQALQSSRRWRSFAGRPVFKNALQLPGNMLMPVLPFCFHNAVAKGVHVGAGARLDHPKQALHQCRIHGGGSVSDLEENGNLCVERGIGEARPVRVFSVPGGWRQLMDQR